MRKKYKTIMNYTLLILVCMLMGKIASNLESKYQLHVTAIPREKKQSITVSVDVVAPTYYERMINKTDAIHIPMKP